ncbi:hypothetical protein L9F63_004792 [Diploptera punctata]|uniref:Ionotropic glutamate receptor C-terminal domain-containing protein n=1 Tax=Diploptera punctata TaxID=6984 RepID=A0AAD7ZGH1_DIPPU|nr:hypothetical protein L9F63_004792 [Diploptera punctata]
MKFKLLFFKLCFLCISSNHRMFAYTETENAFLQLIQEIGMRYIRPQSRVLLMKNEYIASMPISECFSAGIVSCLQLDVNSVVQDVFSLHDWPYEVIDANVMKYNFIDGKFDFYFLLSSFPSSEDMKNEFKVQMQRLNSLYSWNPRAKFVIFATQAQENNIIVASDVLAEVWTFKVVSVIFIIPNNMNFTLDVYTWFPYSIPGRCADVKDATLLDQWIFDIETQGFLYNVQLFPEKVPSDLHGCPLRISTFDYPPFIFRIKYLDDDTITFERGLEFKLIEQMAQTTNMTMMFRKAPPDGSKWGFLLENGSWTGIAREIMEDYSDIGMAGWWYRCHLIKEMECLTPHLIDACRWFVPCSKPYPRWMSTTRVFKQSLWLSFLSAYVLVSLVMWKVVKVSNSISQKPIENQAYTSLVKCFLNFWAIILEESASNNPPHVGVIRTIFLVWVLYCWAVNTVYQTFLTSFLIDPGLQHAISSEEEIFASKIEYGIPETIVSIVPGLSDRRYRHRDHCDDLQGCRDRLAFKSDFALFFSRYNMEYLAAAKYMAADGKSLVCKFDEVYCNQLTIMPVPTGLILLERFNDIILHVLQSGLMEYWWRNLRYTATLELSMTISEPVGEYIKLTLEHLQSAFYLLFIGYIISVVIFISEIICSSKFK